MSNAAKPPGEFWTAERCYITELLNDPARPDVSLARARVTPGTTTELHALGVREWYVIEQGNGLMRVGGAEPFTVTAGDTVEIPANCEQQIKNTGDADLLFFCVCVPRFTPATYRSLE